MVYPLLQDNVLKPYDFAEYIHHIVNAFEMHSIIQSELIPGGKSLRRDRQSVFFTVVDPMDTQQDRREVQYKSGQTHNRTVQKQLESSSQFSLLVQLKACSNKGTAILSNSIACNFSFRHTTSDLYRKWYA